MSTLTVWIKHQWKTTVSPFVVVWLDVFHITLNVLFQLLKADIINIVHIITWLFICERGPKCAAPLTARIACFFLVVSFVFMWQQAAVYNVKALKSLYASCQAPDSRHT